MEGQSHKRNSFCLTLFTSPSASLLKCFLLLKLDAKVPHLSFVFKGPLVRHPAIAILGGKVGFSNRLIARQWPV